MSQDQPPPEDDQSERNPPPSDAPKSAVSTKSPLEALRSERWALDDACAKATAAADLACSKATRMAQLVASIEAAITDYVKAREEKVRALATINEADAALWDSLDCHVKDPCRGQLVTWIDKYADELDTKQKAHNAACKCPEDDTVVGAKEKVTEAEAALTQATNALTAALQAGARFRQAIEVRLATLKRLSSVVCDAPSERAAAYIEYKQHLGRPFGPGKDGVEEDTDLTLGIDVTVTDPADALTRYVTKLWGAVDAAEVALAAAKAHLVTKEAEQAKAAKELADLQKDGGIPWIVSKAPSCKPVEKDAY